MADGFTSAPQSPGNISPRARADIDHIATNHATYEAARIKELGGTPGMTYPQAMLPIRLITKLPMKRRVFKS